MFEILSFLKSDFKSFYDVPLLVKKTRKKGAA